MHTVVRPTAGGLAFGSGSTATTAVVTDPASFFSSNQWVPVVRAAEDVGSVAVSVLAILVPILIILVIPLDVWLIWG